MEMIRPILGTNRKVCLPILCFCLFLVSFQSVLISTNIGDKLGRMTLDDSKETREPRKEHAFVRKRLERNLPGDEEFVPNWSVTIVSFVNGCYVA